MDGGTRNLYTKKPVRKLEDLKGMKIRPSSSAEATLIRMAGGSAVPGANPQAPRQETVSSVKSRSGVVSLPGSRFTSAPNSSSYWLTSRGSGRSSAKVPVPEYHDNSDALRTRRPRSGVAS